MRCRVLSEGVELVFLIFSLLTFEIFMCRIRHFNIDELFEISFEHNLRMILKLGIFDKRFTNSDLSCASSLGYEEASV